jgi:hypothetical protein
LGVEDREAAGAVAVGIAEHRDDDVVAGHAVDRVWARVAGLRDHLVRLDDLVDLGAAGVVGHIDEVEARGAEAGDDQVRAIGPVTRGRAAVPAEVVELVTDVGHRQLVDDPAFLGVDDSEEVGRVDTGALMKAGEVEEFLGRGLHRLCGRAVERRRFFWSGMHNASFQGALVGRFGRGA